MNKNQNFGRLLFWFRDSDFQLYDYTVKFGPLAMLLCRLINENYSGKKIKFININFCSPQIYIDNKSLKENYTHEFGGDIRHNSIFYKNEFDKLDFEIQKKQLWNFLFEIMLKIASDTKNIDLKSSVESAFKKGIENGLLEDFILLEEIKTIKEKNIRVELWANFENSKVFANLKIYVDNDIKYSKLIDSSSSDNEFFYTMFKKIIIDEKGNIVIKGHYEIEYLPIKIQAGELLS
jgi:hypothetical protein